MVNRETRVPQISPCEGKVPVEIPRGAEVPTMAGLDEPALGQAPVRAAADDDVIVHEQPQEAGALDELAREVDVPSSTASGHRTDGCGRG